MFGLRPRFKRSAFRRSATNTQTSGISSGILSTYLDMKGPQRYTNGTAKVHQSYTKLPKVTRRTVASLYSGKKQNFRLLRSAIRGRC